MMKSKIILVVGDAVVILLVVLLGLSFHQSDAAERLQFTLVPFLGAWLLAAWALGLYAPAANWGQFWRVPLAAALAAPLGGVLRAAWLGSSALPIFVLVMAATLTLAMLAWRALFILFSKWRS